MAKLHGKAFDTTINSTSFEEYVNSVTLGVSIDTAEVTCASDTAKEYLEGNYGWNYDIGGPADFATDTSDEELFGYIGAGEQAVTWYPNGSTTATTNPEYSGNAIMTSYSISAGVGDAITYSASFIGNGALARTTS